MSLGLLINFGSHSKLDAPTTWTGPVSFATASTSKIYSTTFMHSNPLIPLMGWVADRQVRAMLYTTPAVS